MHNTRSKHSLLGLSMAWIELRDAVSDFHGITLITLEIRLIFMNLFRR